MFRRCLQLFDLMLLEFGFGQVNVELFFMFYQIVFVYRDRYTQLDYFENLVFLVGLGFANCVAEVFRDVHHIFHLQQTLSQKVVEQRNPNFVNRWPAVDQKQIENVQKNLDRKEACKQSNAPFKCEVFCFHVHVSEMSEYFGAVL